MSLSVSVGGTNKNPIQRTGLCKDVRCRVFFRFSLVRTSFVFQDLDLIGFYGNWIFKTDFRLNGFYKNLDWFIGSLDLPYQRQGCFSSILFTKAKARIGHLSTKELLIPSIYIFWNYFHKYYLLNERNFSSKISTPFLGKQTKNAAESTFYIDK